MTESASPIPERWCLKRGETAAAPPHAASTWNHIFSLRQNLRQVRQGIDYSGRCAAGGSDYHQGCRTRFAILRYFSAEIEKVHF